MSNKMREDAIREAARNHAMDEYFNARKHLAVSAYETTLFEAGFDRAWQAARTVPDGYVMVPVDMLDRFPELNELNYSHDGVCELNAWGIDLVLSAIP